MNAPNPEERHNSMNNIHDLKNNQIPEELMIYAFFIGLLDKLFGKHDDIKIDLSIETEVNQGIIHLHWKTIKQLFKISSCVKRNQKLVRQTLLAIVNYLNKTYQFTQPIRFEYRKHDFYDKNRIETKKKYTASWTELHLI